MLMFLLNHKMKTPNVLDVIVFGGVLLHLRLFFVLFAWRELQASFPGTRASWQTGKEHDICDEPFRSSSVQTCVWERYCVMFQALTPVVFPLNRGHYLNSREMPQSIYSLAITRF